MPIKPLFPTEQDLLRARHLVRSLAPLKRLSSIDAEFVARAIAEIRTEGRAQGLAIAKDLLDHMLPDADTARRRCDEHDLWCNGARTDHRIDAAHFQSFQKILEGAPRTARTPKAASRFVEPK